MKIIIQVRLNANTAINEVKGNMASYVRLPMGDAQNHLHQNIGTNKIAADSR